MKPIRIFIPSDVLDAYIYVGHIFAVFSDGTLRIVPLATVFNKLVWAHPELATVLNMAILRNDWLLNPQTSAFFYTPDILDVFTLLWQKAAETDFQVKLEHNEWQVMWELPSLPIYDLRLYAMRVYLGHRAGVHEGFVRINKQDDVEPQNGLRKVFDARTIAVSARSGELLFSADNEGLFHGSLWNGEAGVSNTRVTERPCATKSLRTGWKNFDVINYERNSWFSYLRNEIETMSGKPRAYIYSHIDESSEKIRISQMAVDTYSMDAVLPSQLFHPDEIQFCFNNLGTSFFILRDGRFVSIKWAGKVQESARLSSKSRSFVIRDEIGHDIVDKPCSALAFHDGSVIEYFDRVVLAQDNGILTLEDKPVVSVRTFPSSIRFKWLICITREDGLALHTFFPDDLVRKEAAALVR
jgi:hypothetical protein